MKSILTLLKPDWISDRARESKQKLQELALIHEIGPSSTTELDLISALPEPDSMSYMNKVFVLGRGCPEQKHLSRMGRKDDHKGFIQL